MSTTIDAAIEALAFGQILLNEAFGAITVVVVVVVVVIAAAAVVAVGRRCSGGSCRVVRSQH